MNARQTDSGHKMKLWIVTTEFPPFPGGIAPYTKYTAEWLGKQGAQVSVVFFNAAHQGAAKRESFDNYELVTFNDLDFERKRPDMPALGGYAAIAYRIAWFLKKNFAEAGTPDAIEFQDFGGVGYFALQARATLDPDYKDIKIFLTSHRPLHHVLTTNEQSTWQLPNYFYCEMEKFCYRAADAVIYPSNYMVNRLKKDGFIPEKSFVLPNPIPPDLFDLERLNLQETKISSPDLAKLASVQSIAFFGRLQIQKGILDLLDVMNGLWATGSVIKLSIYGRDAGYDNKNMLMSEWIKKQYKVRIESGLLELHGEYVQNEIPVLCSKHDLVVCPYKEESFSYTTAELVLCGALPILSPGGGQQELIPEDQSWLIYDPSDVNSFISTLDRALKLSINEKQQIVEEIRAHIIRLSNPRAVFAQKLEIINSIGSYRRSEFPFVSEIPHAAPGTTFDEVQGLISVVIPYYNLGTLLQDTIESVMSSNYDSVEVIVVNDGSNDPSSLRFLATVEQGSWRYPVRILNKQNGGLSSARNTGAYNSKGEFIFFLDADDMIDHDFFRRATNILQTYNNVHFVNSWLQEFGESDNKYLGHTPELPFLLYRNMSVTSCILGRRRSWLEFGINNPKMKYGMEDYESCVRLVSSGNRFVTLPEYYFKYRIRSESMARQFNSENKAFLYRNIVKHNSETYDKYAEALYMLNTANGPGYEAGDPTFETGTRKRMVHELKSWL